MSLWYSRFYSNRSHDPLTTCPSAWDTTWHTVHRQELPSKLMSIPEFLLFLLQLLWYRVSPCCPGGRELVIFLAQPSECWGYGHDYGYAPPYLLSFALLNIFIHCLKFPIISDILTLLDHKTALTFFICVYFGYIVLLPYVEITAGTTECGFWPGHACTTAFLLIVTVNTRNWTGPLGHGRLCAIQYILTIVFSGKCSSSKPWIS